MTLIFNISSFFSNLPFKHFFFNGSNLSIARLLENCIIHSSNFSGKVIDIGGGSLSSYRNKLASLTSYESINIDISLSPTFLIKATDTSYPAPSSAYNHCLLFNVLEHVYDWSTLLSESRRLLMDGGTLHVLVPFLYPIHDCPDDFLRPSSSYLYRSLSSYGFSNIAVFPISLGPFTSAYSICVPIPVIHFFISRLFVLLDFAYLSFFPSKHSRYCKSFPLIFYCIAS